jgi:hypothetical protein
MNKFVIYIEENELNFTEYFKEELSRQLLKILEYELNSENLLKKYFFALLIKPYGLQIKQRDDYSHMEIEILTPDSMSRTITIGWKSSSFSDKLKIHTDITEGDEIQFCYFNDLPIEELKRYLTKKQRLTQEIETGFEYRVNYESFPNLNMKIGAQREFNLEDITKINQIVEENRAKYASNCYVSEFFEGNVMFDFQVDINNFKGNDLVSVEKFFDGIAKQISSSKFNQNIDYIIVE